MQKTIEVSSSQKYQTIDLTEKISQIVSQTNINHGLCQIFALHATAAITINENWDPNVGKDLQNALDHLIPQGQWLHDQVDNNGAAHIKAAVIGPSETIPIKNNHLQLGQWQNIILCDFDGPKKRKIIINIIPSEK